MRQGRIRNGARANTTQIGLRREGRPGIRTCRVTAVAHREPDGVLDWGRVIE